MRKLAKMKIFSSVSMVMALQSIAKLGRMQPRKYNRRTGVWGLRRLQNCIMANENGIGMIPGIDAFFFKN